MIVLISFNKTKMHIFDLTPLSLWPWHTELEIALWSFLCISILIWIQIVLVFIIPVFSSFEMRIEDGYRGVFVFRVVSTEYREKNEWGVGGLLTGLELAKSGDDHCQRLMIHHPAWLRPHWCHLHHLSLISSSSLCRLQIVLEGCWEWFEEWSEVLQWWSTSYDLAHHDHHAFIKFLLIIITIMINMIIWSSLFDGTERQSTRLLTAE